MSISLLLEMASSAEPDRVAVVCDDVRITTAELSGLADGAAGVITASGAQHVAYVGAGGILQPLLIFGSARAAVPYTPINYRLSAENIHELIARLHEPLIVVDRQYRSVIGEVFNRVMDSDEFVAAARGADPVAEFADPEQVSPRAEDGSGVPQHDAANSSVVAGLEQRLVQLTSQLCRQRIAIRRGIQQQVGGATVSLDTDEAHAPYLVGAAWVCINPADTAMASR
jgi:hypothetical protein